MAKVAVNIWVRVLFGGIAFLIAHGIARAQSSRLEFADDVKMVDCSPVADKPCFRVNLNVINSKGEGEPLPRELSEPSRLARNLTVRVEGQDVTPFYALPTTKNNPDIRLALILIDVSGSMNRRLPTGETRFDATKLAAKRFLQDFDSASDRIAVVPFESHGVVARIKQADFANSAELVRREIDSLPTPKRAANTALYAAINAGIEVLEEQQKQFPVSKVMVVVMTDGQDDVQELKGDDRGLIQGTTGLEQLKKKLQASRIPVYSIGFGGEIDPKTLTQISGDKYLRAESMGELTGSLAKVRSQQMNQLQATFVSPWDRASLLNRGALQVRVSLLLPTGRLESNTRQWLGPGMSLPSFQGLCTQAEKRALLDSQPQDRTPGFWEEALRAILVFVGLGVLLLVLWFGLPRLIWPQTFAPGSGPNNPPRWSNAKAPVPGGAQHSAPPGFTGSNPAAPERRPSDATYVQPKTDSGTRTRLN